MALARYFLNYKFEIFSTTFDQEYFEQIPNLSCKKGTNENVFYSDKVFKSLAHKAFPQEYRIDDFVTIL